MAWQAQSRRRSELPRNWASIRRTVLERDNHTCTIQGPRCTRHANHVDHIDPAGPHNPTNLRSACQHCHMARTQAQATATRPPRHRPPEQHPGLHPPPHP